MLDLRIQACTRSDLSDEEPGTVVGFTRDAETTQSFFLYSSGVVHCLKGHQRQAAWSLATEGADSEGAVLACLTYIQELEALQVAFRTGELFLVECQEQTVEEVGKVEDGIATISWSQDGSLLLVVSCAGNLLLLSQDWIMLHETPLFQNLDRVTPARQLTPESLPPSLSLTAQLVATAWRADSQLFSTISAAQPGAPMVLRMWTREGQLHAVGEAAPGLQPVLAWQPNGRHLFAVQQQPDGQQRVLLFESNGLQHGGFDLGIAGRTVKQLAWSSDSALLAVMVVPRGESQPQASGVQIWVRSNWHWYLKLERPWPHEHARLHHMEWHSLSAEPNGCLVMCDDSGRVESMTVSQAPAVSTRGTAVVTDGKSLLLTPLRHTLAPPPMCAVTANLAAVPVCTALCNWGDAEALATMMSDGQLAIHGCLQADLWEETAESSPHPDSDAPSLGPGFLAHPVVQQQTVRCAVWMTKSLMLLVGTPTEQSESQADLLTEMQLEWEDHKCTNLSIVGGGTEIPGAVLTATEDGDKGALLQLQSGALWQFTAGGGLQHCRLLPSFPAPCQQCWSVPADIVQAGGAPLLGLTASGVLYWGTVKVAESCTSAAVRDKGPGGAFCLWTSRDNFLHCRNFAKLLQPEDSRSSGGAGGPRRPSTWAQQDELHQDMHAAMRGHGLAAPASARAVEAGARIIAAPRGATTVVLQMPRGNLEAVSHRVLVNALIDSALQAQDFATAWRCACTNRVDLVTLVAHGWPAFLTTAALLVAAVPQDQDLVDILACLRPVDGAGGLLAALTPDQVQMGEGDPVAQACSAMRGALQEAGAGKYLRPLLTCHLVRGELQEALTLIKQRKEAHMAASSSHSTLGPEEPSAEEGLGHVLLTVEVSTLYRAALGMYDLEMAYMVVTNSQLDPGEFLLELQEFEKQPNPSLQCYAIDMHLKRHLAALRHLLAAGDAHFDAAILLAQERGLLLDLLGMVPGQAEKRHPMLRALAESLRERGMHEDAAVAYAAAGEHGAALLQYQAAGQWQMALALAGQLQYGPSETTELAEDLLEDLTAMGRLRDAAVLSQQYLQDPDRAVDLLTQARDWREAMRVAWQAGRGQLVGTLVAPAAAEAAEQSMRDATEDCQRVHKYIVRYREVQGKRLAMESLLRREQEEEEGLHPYDDDIEVASTAVTGMSAYARTEQATSAGSTTGRPTSTVGGRRPMRQSKKGKRGSRIRQGGPQEESALAAHITQLRPSQQHTSEAGSLAETGNGPF
ncbi:hypothetical protein WJX73_010410 [Symbiochloris irregularis]|uniref:Elongator complex protein 1 n=1 Tax=Symbiochloris irregularis TaxID=706552 RepID=A0AAW1NND0_9CHLO